MTRGSCGKTTTHMLSVYSPVASFTALFLRFAGFFAFTVIRTG